MVSADVRGARVWRLITEWWWRLAVTAYGVFTVVRGLAGEGPQVAPIQAAQFGTIAIGLAGLLYLELRGRRLAITRPRLPRTRFALFVWSLAAFVVVAALSTVLSEDVGYGMAQLAITVLMLGFVLATAATRWRRDAMLIRHDFAWWVGLAAIVQTIGILVLVVRPDLVQLYAGARFFGVFTNPNFCGIVSAGGLVLAALVIADGRSPRHRPWLIAAMVPLAAALYLSQSRGALIATVVAVATILFFLVRKWFVRVIVIVGALAVAVVAVAIPVTVLRGPDTLLFEPATPAPTATVAPPAETAAPVVPEAPAQPSAPAEAPPVTPPPSPEPTPEPPQGPQEGDLDVQSSGRVGLYKEAVHSWLEAPVLGHGFRSSASQLHGLEPHNLVLEVLVETGVLGVIPFLGACLAIALCFLRRPRNLRYLGPIASIVVTENVTSTAFGWGGPVALITWLILAGAFVWRIQADIPPESDG
jgi:O-antigen ligase